MCDGWWHKWLQKYSQPRIINLPPTGTGRLACLWTQEGSPIVTSVFVLQPREKCTVRPVLASYYSKEVLEAISKRTTQSTVLLWPVKGKKNE